MDKAQRNGYLFRASLTKDGAGSCYKSLLAVRQKTPSFPVRETGKEPQSWEGNLSGFMVAKDQQQSQDLCLAPAVSLLSVAGMEEQMQEVEVPARSGGSQPRETARSFGEPSTCRMDWYHAGKLH